MRRFVYTPQIEAYVRNEATQRTVDLTDDIIGGTVTRRLNAISEAQLTLQNKQGKYTEKIRFDPMDRIVIKASRVGTPFAIFSGYLDEVPLAQLYPQPVSIRASCTLKLLQNTYLDPGLYSLQNFFMQHGWNYNPATGNLQAFSGQVGNLDISGSMGSILRAIMEEPLLGNWQSEAVDIRNIPTSFINKVATVMQEAAKDEQANWDDLADKLRKFLSVDDLTGTASAAAGDGPLGTAAPATGNVDPVDIATWLLDAGAGRNQAADLIAIAHRESGFLSDAINFNGGGDGSSGDGSYDLGIFQFNTIHAPGAVDSGHNLTGPASSAGHDELLRVFRKTAPTWAQTFADQMFTPKLAAKLAVQKDDALHSPWRPGGSQPWDTNISQGWKEDAAAAVSTAIKNRGKTGVTVNTKSNSKTPGVTSRPDEGTRGPNAPSTGGTSVVVQDKPIGNGPFYPLSAVGTNGGGPDAHRSRAFGNWESDQAIDIMVKRDTHVIAVEAGEVGFTGYTPQGTYHHQQNVPDSVVVAGFSSNPSGYGLYLKVGGENKYWYGHLRKVFVKQGQHVKAGTILGLSGAASGADHLHIGVNTSSDSEVINLTHNPTTTGVNPPGGYVDDTGNTIDTGTGPLTAQQVAAIARQATWFTTQLQGGDVIASQSLMGKRALANDISLLNWISELVPATGRVFCSKANGDFLSFFPDYWGWFDRTPYFNISDIETIDLNLTRGDANMVTHVFATGPQFQPDITLLDRMLSMVASVEETAFKFFINVDDDNFDPIDFMKRYGARPHAEDMPNIKHPILLWIKAWMKFTELWSKQFSTPASFTFMPELFPGGLVSFGRSLQMFVEEVTHTFSWESGFTTQASLSSPASIDDAYPMLPRAGKLGRPSGPGDGDPMKRHVTNG